MEEVKERESDQEWWWADQLSLFSREVYERESERQKEQYGQIQRY